VRVVTRNAGSRLVYGKKGQGFSGSKDAFERLIMSGKLCACVQCCKVDPRRWAYRTWGGKK